MNCEWILSICWLMNFVFPILQSSKVLSQSYHVENVFSATEYGSDKWTSAIVKRNSVSEFIRKLDSIYLISWGIWTVIIYWLINYICRFNWIPPNKRFPANSPRYIYLTFDFEVPSRIVNMNSILRARYINEILSFFTW